MPGRECRAIYPRPLASTTKIKPTTLKSRCSSFASCERRLNSCATVSLCATCFLLIKRDILSLDINLSSVCVCVCVCLLWMFSRMLTKHTRIQRASERTSEKHGINFPRENKKISFINYPSSEFALNSSSISLFSRFAGHTNSIAGHKYIIKRKSIHFVLAIKSVGVDVFVLNSSHICVLTL